MASVECYCPNRLAVVPHENQAHPHTNPNASNLITPIYSPTRISLPKIKKPPSVNMNGTRKNYFNIESVSSLPQSIIAQNAPKHNRWIPKAVDQNIARENMTPRPPLPYIVLWHRKHQRTAVRDSSKMQTRSGGCSTMEDATQR